MKHSSALNIAGALQLSTFFAEEFRLQEFALKFQVLVKLPVLQTAKLFLYPLFLLKLQIPNFSNGHE